MITANKYQDTTPRFHDYRLCACEPAQVDSNQRVHPGRKSTPPAIESLTKALLNYKRTQHFCSSSSHNFVDQPVWNEILEVV